jgi:deazaflavin-dependent oxidoreductase (nitroreductase family)
MSESDRPRRNLLPVGMGKINKRVFNPVLKRVAPWVPPAGVVVHVGRRSGRTYRTPVLAVSTGTSVAIPLLYGNRTDWVLNVLAAGAGELIRAGRERRLVNPRFADDAERGRIPWLLRGLSRKVDILLAELEPRAGTP